MAEDSEIKSKKLQFEEELKELRRKCKILQDDNALIEEQKKRLDSLFEMKEAEYKGKKTLMDNINSKKFKKQKTSNTNAERREKEIEDWVTERLEELVLGEKDGRSDRKRTEYEEKHSILISHVTIRYSPNVLDGEQDLFDKTDPFEACFRINKQTTFHQLKLTACQFWVRHN